MHRLQQVNRHLHREESFASASSSSSLLSQDVSGVPPERERLTGKLLNGEVAIVTGSGQGIGREVALLFAEHGAHVVVTDLDAGKSDQVCNEINSTGGSAISVPGDVTDPAFPARIVKATMEKYGKINHLVNNAGYTWDGVIHRMSDKQWDAMLLVHNTAPFRLIREAAPFMRDAAKKEVEKQGFAESRSIVNVSSTSGIHGNAGQINYSTAKMGIVGLTKTVAKEWGSFNIRCNAIAFGMIETRLTQAKEKGATIKTSTGETVKLGIPQAMTENPMRFALTPLARNGKPHEAAAGILYLASPLASFVTGHCLEVTGGFGI